MNHHSLLLLLFFFLCSSARSQPGSLDPSFGVGGKVTVDVGGGSDVGISLAIQIDGKFVMTGYTEIGLDKDVAVVRLNSDGSLDNTFGTGGKVITSIGSEGDFGTGIAIQTDGKIVVGGYTDVGSHNNFAALRYNSDGTLDNTFGDGGIVVTPVVNGDVAWSVAIQSDGKIVLAGFTNDPYSNFFALVRMNTDGTLDNSFGSGGIVTTHVGATDDQIYNIKIQDDGKIVAGGYSSNGSTWDFAVARYNTDGTLDATFGTAGIAITDFDESDEQAYMAALQSDGKIVAAGFTFGNENGYAIARYNTDGSIDNSFNSDGKAIVSPGINDDGTCVVIQDNSKIVMGGNAHNGQNKDFGLVRFNSDGSTDDTFGDQGKAITVIGTGNDICLSLALQNDGNIIAAGYSDQTATGRDFAVVRYIGDPPLGVPPLVTSETVKVFPNPFTTEFTVTGASGEFVLYDITGMQLLKETLTPGKVISAPELGAGMYLLAFDLQNERRYLRVAKLR